MLHLTQALNGTFVILDLKEKYITVCDQQRLRYR